MRWRSCSSGYMARTQPFWLRVFEAPAGWAWEIGASGSLLWRSRPEFRAAKEAKGAAKARLQAELSRCLRALTKEAL